MENFKCLFGVKKFYLREFFKYVKGHFFKTYFFLYLENIWKYLIKFRWKLKIFGGILKKNQGLQILNKGAN